MADIDTDSKDDAAGGASFPVRNLLWPDPDISMPRDDDDDDDDGAATSATNARGRPRPSELLADNISGLQATRVAGFFYPQTVEDVRAVVDRARRFGKKICMRGTAHCMSKTNVAEGALLIDFSFMKRVAVIGGDDGDDNELLVRCEPGAQWRDLIRELNPRGRTPRSMQSYSTFATGGSLSCNAHGITSDDCCADGVVAADIMTSDGVLRTCERDAPEGSRENLLFRHALGGFGLFGVICSLTMRTSPNHSILPDTIVCPVNEFPKLYESILADGGRGSTTAGNATNESPIRVKLARFNFITCDTVQIFLFRRNGYVPSVSKLTDANNSSAPRQMSMASQLLYKWIVPAMLDVRFQTEEATATALDWSDGSTTCNELLFESAEPLARLAEPLFLADDTFVLQEYFVPTDDVLRWIRSAKPIFRDVSANPSPRDGTRVVLLNTTIRVVNPDTVTALPYSTEKTFAFVLYFRLCRNEESVEYLRTFCQRFIRATLECGGRFYLPYLHHYSTEQLLESYPEWPAFIRAKENLDPIGLFDSGWFREYGLAFGSEKYRSFFETADGGRTDGIGSSLPDGPRCDSLEPVLSKESLAELIASVTVRRENSLRKLMNRPGDRSAFFGEFMVNVFSIADERSVERVLSRCCWNPILKNDNEIYSELVRIMDRKSSTEGTPATKLKKSWRQLKQLSDQKAELTDEIVRIMTRLGKLGHAHDLCTMGDRGKLVRSLQSRLGVDGTVYVVHEEPIGDTDDLHLAVETGSNTPVGQMFECQFNASRCRFPFLPDRSTDLVTMMQGLHHIEPRFLSNFLTEVERVLRPGGVFLVREHDLAVTGTPMIDAAHIVFNALTGVSYIEECNEVRAFRTLADWRKIITACTSLEDAMLFEVQRGDPTHDVMMCFYKPPLFPPEFPEQAPAPICSDPRAAPPVVPRLAFQATVEKFPETLLRVGREILTEIAPLMDAMGDRLAPILAPSPAMAPFVRETIRSNTRWIAEASAKLAEQTGYVRPKKLQIETVPSELFYGFLAVKKKVETGKASPQEAVMVNAVLKVFNALLGIGDGGDDGNDNEEPGTQNSDVAAIETAGKPSYRTIRQQMMNQLTKLLKYNPNLINHGYLLKRGFPEPFIDALANILPPSVVIYDRHTNDENDAPDIRVDAILLETAVIKLESHTDSESWSEISRHLDRITDGKGPAVELDFDALLGRDCKSYGDEISPWCSVLLACLGSSRLRLGKGAMLLARWYGFSELEALYRHAQNHRAAGRRQHSSRHTRDRLVGTTGEGEGVLRKEEHPLGLSSDLQRQLDEAVAAMNAAPIRTVTINNVRQRETLNIYYVKEVMRAEYGGKDVTEIVKQKLLRTVTAPTTGETTTGIILDCINKPLDKVFSYGLTPMSVYFYGARSLTITYRSSESVVPADGLAKSVGTLKRVLEQSSIESVRAFGKSRKTASATLRNLFKVLEYLQVEILKDFAHGLEDTPWYRFDFAKTIQSYFSVLAKTLHHGINDFGLQTTLTSNGFVTALVPGLVMGFILTQVQLLALPVVRSLGESYDPRTMKSRWLVRLEKKHRKKHKKKKHHRNEQSPWPASFNEHPGVTIVPIHDDQGIVMVETPVFLDFSNLVCNLARHNCSSSNNNSDGRPEQPQATILEIDGNDRIALKVHRRRSCSAAAAAAAAATASQGGDSSTGNSSGSSGITTTPMVKLLRAMGIGSIREIAGWNLCNDSLPETSPREELFYSAITVSVPELLTTIAVCDRADISVDQIFEFYE